MSNFKDLNIIVQTSSFVGDKIKIDRILNREISILAYRIEPTKIPGKIGDCLYMQILLGETKHVVFTSGIALIEALQQVEKKDFPVVTTIIKQNDRLFFS